MALHLLPRTPLVRGAVIVFALLALLGGGALWWRARSRPAPALPPRDAPYLDGDVIRFSEGFARRNGVTAVAAAPKELEPLVSVTGQVSFDIRKFAAIGARIPGRIRRVFKVVGDPVREHEPLAEIESAELGRAEALLVGAAAKEKGAESVMKRERSLVEARIGAERDAEAARVLYEAVRAERVAAQRTVIALGGGQNGESGVLILRSPIAGAVVASKAARGQTVEPTLTLYEVADLSTVWVELRVSERDLSAIAKGDSVEIISPGHPPQTLKGQVDHVGVVVQSDTRTAAVRVVAENRQGFLRPGQSVHARIHTAGPVGKLLTVPRTAVSRIDGKPTVLIMLDSTTVKPRVVELGLQDGDDAAIAAGLKEGERVVVGGLFALKSEIFR